MDGIRNVGFIIGRIIVGIYYAYSGIEHFILLHPMSQYAAAKGVPIPELAVAFTGILLLIGGISILLGVYPWVGVLSLIIFFVPVTFIMHAFWKVQDPTVRMGEMINFMKNMGLMGSALIFLAIPEPWKMSIKKNSGT